MYLCALFPQLIHPSFVGTVEGHMAYMQYGQQPRATLFGFHTEGNIHVWHYDLPLSPMGKKPESNSAFGRIDQKLPHHQK